jgi:hypothetical protein
LLSVGKRGVKEIMVTAKECCDRAAACERIAAQTTDTKIERSYLILAKTWRDFAERLELMDLSGRHAVIQSIRLTNGAR